MDLRVDLRDRVALVTGAARRLGYHIAHGLARSGSSVVVHYHESSEEAERAADEFRALGVDSIVVQADLRSPEQIHTLFERVEEHFGALDILVNSAAVLRRCPVPDLTPQEWDHVLDLNLRAPVFCSQRASRLMSARGGKIINIADVAAYRPWSGYPHHSIAKAGLVMATQVLARAMAPRIQVNAIAPGTVLPPEEYDEGERARLARATALQRLGTPDDVTEAVLFLVQSSYITGQTIIVDGGRMLLDGG